MEITKSIALDQPIFIVGPLRSGTTMLRLLVGKHPDIHCFGEFECSVSQAKQNTWPELPSFYEFVQSDRQTCAYNFTINPTLDYPSLVKHFLEQQYDNHPGGFIGASIHSRIDLLPKLWPNAKFIHILRDPRDVARSCIGMGWVGNVFKGSDYWLTPEQHWDTLCEFVPIEQRLTIKYEDLVRAPEEKLAQTCKFLSLPYSEQMINIDENSTYSKPDGSYADQWRSKLSSREIRWVEQRCQVLMKNRGYEITSDLSNTISLSERIWVEIQNRYYRASFNIHRYGLKNWLSFIILKRVGNSKQKRAIKAKINQIQTAHLK